jgi:hypothetical protein
VEIFIKAGGKYGAAVTLHFILALVLAVPAAAEPVEELDVDGGYFDLEWRGEFSAAERGKLKNWLQSVAATMKKLHGTLPRPRTRIVLQQYPSKTVVPFARVLRNGDQGILFYINPEYPLDDFINDWTAYHEFTHLFIPFPGRSNIWFSEGLASYYQNVLQYRGGLLTEAQAWQKLYEGFERGRADNRNPDYTLAELCSNLRETHAFMRVYWTGALYFLEADLRLRSRSKDRITLDHVLQTFGRCCLHERKRWTGMDIAVEFDRIVGDDLFVPLYSQYENSTAIPDFIPVLNAAGVKIRDDRVEPDSHTSMTDMPLRAE